MHTESMFVDGVVNNDKQGMVKAYKPHAALEILTRRLNIFNAHWLSECKHARKNFRATCWLTTYFPNVLLKANTKLCTPIPW